MNDLISIIIPVRNGANFIGEAIEHIKSQVMNVELIVVDDASDDETVSIAESYGCTIVRHDTRKGQVAGKNSGLKAAHGDFILFHDHDDVMRPGALDALYSSFDGSTSAVEAMVQDFYSPGLSDAQKHMTPIKEEPYYGLFTGAILMRKSVFDIIGYFSETVTAGEIIDWEFKMKDHGLVCKKIDFIATDRRVHSSNYGKTNRDVEFANYAALLRARLAKMNKV